MTSPTPSPDPSAVSTQTPTPQPSPTPTGLPAPTPSATPTPSAPPSPSATQPTQSAPPQSSTASATPSSEPSSEQNPEPDPGRPSEPDTAAIYDAIVTEHATIYGYGIVSAHTTPEDNGLVSEAMAAHRQQREALLAMLSKRSVAIPLTAPGYQLPSKVDDPTDAANLAVRMEEDAATALRAVLEQATNSEDRAFAVSALTQSAVLAARWKQVLEIWPMTTAFPGGSE